jgi:hypothetical protein
MGDEGTAASGVDALGQGGVPRRLHRHGVCATHLEHLRAILSQPKYVLTDHHKKMDRETIEALMLLSYNRSMWSVFTIDPIRKSGVKIYQ